MQNSTGTTIQAKSNQARCNTSNLC